MLKPTSFAPQKALASFLALAVLCSSPGAKNAYASLGEQTTERPSVAPNGASVQQPLDERTRNAKMKFRRYGGHVVLDRNRNVICGGSPYAANIGTASCESNPQVMALVLQTKPQYAAAEVKGVPTAAVPVIALIGASILCGTSGFATSVILKQKRDIIITDPFDGLFTFSQATSGFLGTLWPVKVLMRSAAPGMSSVAGVSTAVAVGGAVCTASAGAGYAIHHFFFNSSEDIQPAKR